MDAVDLRQIETKLAAARTRLIMDRPFIGSLVMHLPLTAITERWCDTTATDARAFYFNPNFIARLSFEETQFILAHEALHCALGHFARRMHRQKKRWDIACEHAVNLLLLDEGLKPPKDALANHAWSGLSAEEIYPLVPGDTAESTLDNHLFDDQDNDGDNPEPPPDQPPREGDGKGAAKPREANHDDSAAEPPRPASGPEQDKLEEQWRSRLAGAAQMAQQAGKLSEHLARVVDALLAPQLPWRALLARYLVERARDDYSWRKPSRREGEAILPRLSSSGLDIVIAVDVSGSVDEEELREFLTEVDALKGQVRAGVTLMACDDELSESCPWRFEPWETLDIPLTIKGGGGTDFRPVFARIEADDLAPDLLVYFTDAEGTFPEQPPAYPVVWLVKGKGRVPWGERIQLN